MKNKLIAALVLAATVPAALATNVGVSVEISQPGVYGRVDIGRFPQPTVIVQQPVVIAQPRVMVAAPPEPVYLWVPPGHQRNWRKHCGRYNACGVPVYFVQDRWYREHVVADRGRRGDDDRGRRGDDDRGRGHGHGHGKGHGKGHD